MNGSLNYLILGGGISSVAAAKAIRDADSTGNITIVTAEAGLPFNRPRLTKTLIRGYDPARDSVFPGEWFANNRIKIKNNAVIESLSSEDHKVCIKGGEVLSYDRCVYALGGESFIPPIPGARDEGVINIRTAEDIERTRRAMAGARSAVIIGGGVIGIELAMIFMESGIKVTIVEGFDYILGRLVDEPMARMVEEKLRSAGAEILTGARVLGIQRRKEDYSVNIEGLQAIECNMVVVSAGVRPVASVAKDAGLAVGRGVLVDEHMRTSDPDIFAAGDCIEYNGQVLSSWTQSLLQAETAGINCAGGNETVALETPPARIEGGLIKLWSLGDLGKERGVNYEVLRGKARGAGYRFEVNPRRDETHVSCYFKDGRLCGAAALGGAADTNLLAEAVTKAWSRERVIAEGLISC